MVLELVTEVKEVEALVTQPLVLDHVSVDPLTMKSVYHGQLEVVAAGAQMDKQEAVREDQPFVS